jgi:hypothetical protein
MGTVVKAAFLIRPTSLLSWASIPSPRSIPAPDAYARLRQAGGELPSPVGGISGKSPRTVCTGTSLRLECEN